jgi:polysaccharide deacetylase 2 family uncharacterized protein YibQ
MIRYWLILLACALSPGVAADQRPVLSLVIDDLGYSLENGLAAIDLEGDHTYAILPGAAYSRRLAQHAHHKNKEVILHLPMQSISSRAAHEPNALNETMDEDQLLANVHSLLAEVPFIRGVNNHMGSHLTEYDFFMRPVMDSIRSYNRSLYLTRDIFLDNETNPESIRLQYNIWLTQARERGSAIAIGHPYPNTLEVLRESLVAANLDFRFLRISSLIDERKTPGAADSGGARLSSLPTVIR